MHSCSGSLCLPAEVLFLFFSFWCVDAFVGEWAMEARDGCRLSSSKAAWFLINFSYLHVCVVCVWIHVPCALAHVGIHMNGCMPLWRPEVDAKSLTLHLTHWGWVSQVNVEHAGRLFRPAGLLWDFPCLYLLSAGVTGGPPHSPGFCVGSDEGSKFWSSHLRDGYFNHRSSSSSPHYFFLR